MFCDIAKIGKIRSFIERQTGLYTKKGCVETATRIGKELINLQRSGKDITPAELLACIQTKAPHVKLPDIAYGKDEYLSLMREKGIDELSQKMQIMSVTEHKEIAGVFDRYVRGIYLRTENDIPKTRFPGILAHEFEHYIEYFNNPQTVLKTKLNIRKKIRENSHDKWVQSHLNSPDKDKFIEQELSKIKNSEMRTSLWENLMERFGLDKNMGIIPETGIIKGYPSTPKGVEEFLKSEKFNGLSSSKRIDAYIRAILRHYIHPKATNSSKLKNIRNSFKRESTAYRVNDNLSREARNDDNLTAYMIIAEINKRAGKILDNEIKLARKNKINEMKKLILAKLKIIDKDTIIHPKRPKRCGLPTSAVAKTKQD